MAIFEKKPTFVPPHFTFIKMQTPPISKDELARLADLLSYNILDTPGEAELDEIVHLASEICGTPISTISLIDENRQWFKARKGLKVAETGREFAFCAHAIHGDDLMMVPDAKADERFHDNPLVDGDPHIRFYAGVPLRSSQGHNLGTLCVIGTEPAHLTEYQERALKTLARQVVTHFELGKNNRLLKESLRTIDNQRQLLESHNLLLTQFISVISHDLRSPVDNLQQLFGMFVKGQLSAEEISALGDKINRSLSTTSALLNNLLSWAATQLTGDARDFPQLNLHAIVEEQFTAIETHAKAKRNQLVNDVPAEYVMEADLGVIRFVVRNLINNANKFTSEGQITVAVEGKADSHVLKIVDSGTGMSEKDLNQLFNWENRRSVNGTSGEKGSGLGLLIIKQFAEQYQGSLTIQSELGKGTSVSFEMAKNLKKNALD